MATSQITHTVETPSGTELIGVMVRVTLSEQAFRSDDTAVAREQWFTTDTNGQVVMTLERNADTTAPTSFYSAEVQLPEAYGGPELYTFRVGASNQSLADARVSV